MSSDFFYGRSSDSTRESEGESFALWIDGEVHHFRFLGEGEGGGSGGEFYTIACFGADQVVNGEFVGEDDKI